MPQSSLMTWLKKTEDKAEASSGVDHGNASSPKKSSRVSADDQPTASATSNGGSTTAPVENSFGNRQLVSNIEIRSCTAADIQPLKRLFDLLMPIAYPDSFYRGIVEGASRSHLTLLAFWHDAPAPKTEAARLIGAITCRELPDGVGEEKIEGSPSMLYVSALAVLSPYRCHGVATHLLDAASETAVAECGVRSVGAHVWEANEDGLEWYRRRGFEVIAHEPTYYRKLKPQGAAVVKRDVMDIHGRRSGG